MYTKIRLGENAIPKFSNLLHNCCVKIQAVTAISKFIKIGSPVWA